MARYAFTLAALVAIAQAIMITSPSMDGVWDLSEGAQTITWSSVSTDTSVVDIYLVHMAAHPPIMDKLFANVDINKGSESVSGLQLPTGENYQINFVSPGKPEQILAQSQQFTVKGQASGASSTLGGYTGASATPSTSYSSSTSSHTPTLSSSYSETAASSSSTAPPTKSSSLTSSSGTAPTATPTTKPTGTATNTATATGTYKSSPTGSSNSTETSGSDSDSGSGSKSGSSKTASASASKTAPASGAAATSIPMMGLLVGAAAFFL
ncbi:hypothetical protein DSL72_009217 [Monilinia vaccinii-corymbosi]|uniref:Yeast cell wall synthesis Kre9/Knh1-like N-terminal domain-containing protein n=1 Tax=Monilinia vaccinii-corymbosi TaxID=61207 RepID=A0A8A3PQF6_9HELO|nr:hypothetical protein DSL72_009217 [Monilinia vaccinii-corymbosi]